MGALLLFLTAVLATLVLYFWARKAQLEKQLVEEREANERLMSVAEDLKKADKKNLDTLDRLCEQYYIYEGTENLHPRILKEVRSIVEGLRSDPAVQKSLEQSLNARYDGVMTKLREAFPLWKEEDYLLYMFTASGFSSTTISTLLEKDKPYVYNKLYRLKERIRQSDTTHRDQLLAVLQK
jgi:hypothetical protein